MFILSRYLNHFKRLTFFHYLLFIEMLVGILLLHSFLTIHWSIQSNYNILKQDLENSIDNLLFINQVDGALSNRYQPNKELNLTFSDADLKEFEKRYGDELTINTTVVQYNNFIYNGSIETIFVYFVSEGVSFDHYPGDSYDFSSNPSLIYVGKQALQIMNNGIPSDGAPYEMLTDLQNKQIHFTFHNGQKTRTYPMKVTNDYDNHLIRLNQGEIEIDFSKIIIIPLKEYFENNMITNSDSSNMNISFYFSDFENSFRIKNDILMYLIDTYSEEHTTFKFDNRLDQFRRITADMKQISQAVSAISIFTILIMGIGLVGLMLNMIRKRQKEIAISKAIGASDNQLSLEILLEILTLTFFPALAANVLSMSIIKYFETTEFKIIQSIEVSLITITFSLLIGLLTFLFANRRIRNVYPVIEMKGD